MENINNNFLKITFKHLTILWKKLSVIRKICFLSIFIVVIGGFAALLSLSSMLNLVPVINAPIRDDFIPINTSPWQVFDKPSRIITDMGYKINIQRAQKQIIDQIKTIEGVDNISLNIVWPKEELFHADQKLPSASLVIFPTSGSDITKNIKKINVIQKILKIGIIDLEDENIIIVDQNGEIINDFYEYERKIEDEHIKRNEDLQNIHNNKIEKLITEYIMAIEVVYNVVIKIVWSKPSIYDATVPKPTSAIVVIFPTPGSVITQNKEKIEKIKKILNDATRSLKDENIFIVIGHNVEIINGILKNK